MSKLAKNILKKIKKETKNPTPRWHFVAKNLAIWAGALILTILGIHATMFIFYFSMNLEILDLVLEMPRVFPKIILFGIPFFWIVLMFGLSFFTGYSMKKTKRGYKLSFMGIILGIIVFQLSVGYILACTSFAERVENRLQKEMGFESLAQKKAKIWDLPEYGLLSGKITVMEAEEWGILNRRGEEWKMIIAEETALPQNIEFEVGHFVKMKGSILDEKEKLFQANEVFPMKGRRKEFRKFLEKNFSHLPPEERRQLQEQVHRDGPSRFRKMMERLPEEKRVKILEAMEGKSPEEMQKLFYEMRETIRSEGGFEGPHRGLDLPTETIYDVDQVQKIEKLREINDN